MILAAIHLASALRHAGDDVAAELDPERRRELEERRRRQSAGEEDEARE